MTHKEKLSIVKAIRILENLLRADPFIPLDIAMNEKEGIDFIAHDDFDNSNLYVFVSKKVGPLGFGTLVVSDSMEDQKLYLEVK